jgi:hypothetical protein
VLADLAKYYGAFAQGVVKHLECLADEKAKDNWVAAILSILRHIAPK